MVASLTNLLLGVGEKRKEKSAKQRVGSIYPLGPKPCNVLNF